EVNAINPEAPNLLTDVAYCQEVVCDWSQSARIAQDLRSRAVAGTSPVDPFLFLGIETRAEEQLACAPHWLRHKNIAGMRREWQLADFAGDKLRIAYLSADYHRHATVQLIAELFELHDRNRFEIVGVSFGPNDRSEERSRVVKSFDRFFDVTTRSNAD